jgi:hypothetical protein
MTVSKIPVGDLLSVSESLRKLADDEVARGAVQAVVILMVPGDAEVKLRGFGAGCDSDRAHVLLGLALRRLETWFEEAI